MNQEDTQALSPATLAHFTGTQRYFQHSLRPDLVMTEGVHHITEHGMAWFVDIIASVQGAEHLRDEPFQVWKLQKSDGDSAVAYCEGGDDAVIYRQEIGFTDYPFDSFTAWAVHDGERRVVMLPSEY